MIDHSIKVPRGVIEDVLVRVYQFYFPIDFVVLYTHTVLDPLTRNSVILGRPFIATSNVMINCRNGMMKLTFENMKTKMNVFEMDKSPLEELDDFVVVIFVDVLYDEYLEMYALRDILDYYEACAYFGDG